MLGNAVLEITGGTDVITSVSLATENIDVEHFSVVVELRGLEPRTSSMPLKRSPR